MWSVESEKEAVLPPFCPGIQSRSGLSRAKAYDRQSAVLDGDAGVIVCRKPGNHQACHVECRKKVSQHAQTADKHPFFLIIGLFSTPDRQADSQAAAATPARPCPPLNLFPTRPKRKKEVKSCFPTVILSYVHQAQTEQQLAEFRFSRVKPLVRPSSTRLIADTLE